MVFPDIQQLDSDGQNAGRVSLVRTVLDKVNGVLTDQHFAGDLVTWKDEGTLLHVPDSIARAQLGNYHAWKKDVNK